MAASRSPGREVGCLARGLGSWELRSGPRQRTHSHLPSGMRTHDVEEWTTDKIPKMGCARDTRTRVLRAGPGAPGWFSRLNV